MPIAEEVIREIISRVDIIDLIGRYVKLQRRGERYWGLSPFKTEKTASFSVTPEKGVFYCFSTQKGGDIITFIREIEHLDFLGAVSFLAESAGLTHLLTKQKGIHDDSYRARKEMLTRLCKSFKHLLCVHPAGKKAREYLAERGITQEAMDTFQLGYVLQDPSWVYSMLRKHNYSDSVIFQTGLFSERKNFLFSGRVVFPIHSMQGEVVAFGGRLLSGNGPKYINSRDTDLFRKRKILYAIFQALPAMRRDNVVYVVEGYFDVIAMHAAGFTATVAPLGTALSIEHMQILRRYVERLVFVYDNDEAGSMAVIRSGIQAEEIELPTAVASLPPGCDPADLCFSDRIQELQDAIASAQDMFNFALAYYTEQSSDAKKRPKQLISKVFYYISKVPSEIQQQNYLFLLADELELDRHIVTMDFQRYNKQHSHTQYYQEQDSQNAIATRQEYKTVDMVLLTVLFRKPKLFEQYRDYIDDRDILDKHARELFSLLEDSYRLGEIRASDWNILHRIQDEILRNYIAETINSDEFSDEENILKDSLRRIRIRKWKAEQGLLERKIRQLEQKGAVSSMERRDLLAQKQHVDKQLKELR